MGKLYCLICWSLLMINYGLTAQVPGTLYADLAPAIDLVVAADHTGNYTTLQEAIDATQIILRITRLSL